MTGKTPLFATGRANLFLLPHATPHTPAYAAFLPALPVRTAGDIRYRKTLNASRGHFTAQTTSGDEHLPPEDTNNIVSSPYQLALLPGHLGRVA